MRSGWFVLISWIKINNDKRKYLLKTVDWRHEVLRSTRVILGIMYTLEPALNIIFKRRRKSCVLCNKSEENLRGGSKISREWGRFWCVECISENQHQQLWIPKLQRVSSYINNYILSTLNYCCDFSASRRRITKYNIYGLYQARAR